MNRSGHEAMIFNAFMFLQYMHQYAYAHNLGLLASVLAEIKRQNNKIKKTKFLIKAKSAIAIE